MKKLFLLLSFICEFAYGAANDMVFTKRNPENTGQNTVVYASPSSIGFLAYDPAISNVTYVTIGAGLSVSGGVLNPGSSIGKAFAETTQKLGVFPIFKSATVAGGEAVFHLTADGLSTGTALCTEVLSDSVAVIVNDATASYQMSWAFSNSNKTLTVTANKLTAANILTGLLGQAAANGAVVKLSIFCA